MVGGGVIGSVSDFFSQKSKEPIVHTYILYILHIYNMYMYIFRRHYNSPTMHSQNGLSLICNIEMVCVF